MGGFQRDGGGWLDLFEGNLKKFAERSSLAWFYEKTSRWGLSLR